MDNRELSMGNWVKVNPKDFFDKKDHPEKRPFNIQLLDGCQLNEAPEEDCFTPIKVQAYNDRPITVDIEIPGYGHFHKEITELHKLQNILTAVGVTYNVKVPRYAERVIIGSKMEDRI